MHHQLAKGILGEPVSTITDLMDLDNDCNGASTSDTIACDV
jgi:hypothetical protein